jgi:hypothetical protein
LPQRALFPQPARPNESTGHDLAHDTGLTQALKEFGQELGRAKHNQDNEWQWDRGIGHEMATSVSESGKLLAEARV